MDITNIVNHLESKTHTRTMAPLVDRLAKRADVNRDGNVSSAEFCDFLAKLTDSMDGNASTGTQAAEQTAASSALAPTRLPSGSSAPASTMDALRALTSALAKVR
jgi:hypothetical protein